MKTAELICETKKTGDLLDITGDVKEAVSSCAIKNGLVLVFGVGSTCGIATFEYEPGLKKDVREFYEKIVPSGRSYEHDKTWGDANGFSHLRASLCGQSFAAPIVGGEVVLGTWQQIVLAEFDNRPRNRRVILQIIGE